MNESLTIWGIVISVICFSCIISHFIMRLIANMNIKSFIKIIIAGFLPLILLIVSIAIWHKIDFEFYLASGSQEGYMGPLNILLGGFPVLLLMLFLNLLVANMEQKNESKK